MSSMDDSRARRTISRREFAGKGLVAAIGLAAAGIGGYKIAHSARVTVFVNYHRMGHCAPSVMQTLLDLEGINNPDLVKFSGAMAGGIAGPAMECGAFTAPLMYHGYKQGVPSRMDEKLMIIRQVQAYFSEFNQVNGSTICSNIRGRRNEDGCWKAVSGSCGQFGYAKEHPFPLSAETEKSYTLLLQAFHDAGFHCSHNVLKRLKDHIDINNDLYGVLWPFMGGIAMLNRTCGSLAAGVMVLSSSLAEIETGFVRVARMNRMLKENDKAAMNPEMNGFNRAILAATELGTWFRKEFGSTSCYDMCGYTFSLHKDAEHYLSENCMGRCAHVSEKVAEKVIRIFKGEST